MYFSAMIVSDLIDFAASKGADPEKLHQLFPVEKEQKHISYDTIANILKHIGQLLEDDNLGLHIGEQMALKTTAYVDSIMLHSETLENAFSNAVEYSKIISDALESKLVKRDEKYSVIFEENPNWKVIPTYTKRQILDLTLLSCLKSLVAYTKKAYYPTEIHFQSEKPKHINEYYRLFNCTLKFNAKHSEIVFEKQIFDQHTKQIKYGLLENLKAKVRKEIENLSAENNLIYQLKKVILNHKPERVLLEEAALQLNLSGRTLQRKLKQLNTSFKTIEHELQLRLSKTYLEENQKSIDEISYLLGFSESSAFIRFFKSLMDITPTEYANTMRQVYQL